VFHNDHWVMYCLNLVHSRIDIFDSNKWEDTSLVDLHKPLKEKIPLIYKALIYKALCEVIDGQKKKMSNIAHFKSPFNPCTKQAHSNDDGFFAWKNIES
jgi:hypothetical protein